MANSRAFDTACTELERNAGIDRWASRGAIRLALMEAGLETETVSATQMKVVLDRVLPKQLRSLGVSDSAIVCERIENALLLLTDEPRIETADSIFKRIAT